MTSLSLEAAQSIKREFLLPVDQVKRLQSLAESRHISESRVVEKALDAFFSLADVFDQDTDRQVWYRLSEPALLRVWENDPDSAYDNWRELYVAPEG